MKVKRGGEMGKTDGESFRQKWKERYKLWKLNREVVQALERKEFQVYYQPKIESGSTRVVGAEALVRWKKASGSFIFPNDFIPAIEESGKVVDVDFYVYEKVFEGIYRRLQKGLPVVPVSLNVSRAHLRNMEISDYVDRLFEKYPIPHKYIEFELTESMYVQNMDMILPFVENFRRKGGRISMDDFGSGYSSLNLLTDLPIDTLKVDRVFLKHKELLENEKTILGCVINMAKKLKLDVLCEGVETWEQSWFLSLMGCDMFQGFLYSKPLPEDEYYRYLEQHLEAEVNEIHFAFDGNLKDDSGQYEGIFRNEKISFCEGPAKGMSALHFRGGEPYRDSVELPVEMLKNDSYSVSMWIYEEAARLWGSVFYMGYENGFSSIMPKGWNMNMSFRVKDATDSNGWHDVRGDILPMKKWNMVTACYNSINNVSTMYINGIRAGILENVTNLVAPKAIFLGGDIYVKGFEGKIADLHIFDQPLSFEQVRELYEKTYEKIKQNPTSEEELMPERVQGEGTFTRMVRYALNGNLWSEADGYVARFLGEKIEFREGPVEGMQALKFSGGASMSNVLEVPCDAENLEEFAISFWMRDDNPREWVSVFYAETEHGFIAYMPLIMNKHAIFRFKDNNKDNVWYDTNRPSTVRKGCWHHVVLMYHKDFYMTELYVDGENVGMKDDCFSIGRIKKMYFGGDIYQSCFEGCIADIRIFDKPLRIEEILEQTKLSVIEA